MSQEIEGVSGSEIKIPQHEQKRNPFSLPESHSEKQTAALLRDVFRFGYFALTKDGDGGVLLRVDDSEPGQCLDDEQVARISTAVGLRLEVSLLSQALMPALETIIKSGRAYLVDKKMPQLDVSSDAEEHVAQWRHLQSPEAKSRDFTVLLKSLKPGVKPLLLYKHSNRLYNNERAAAVCDFVDGVTHVLHLNPFSKPYASVFEALGEPCPHDSQFCPEYHAMENRFRETIVMKKAVASGALRAKFQDSLPMLNVDEDSVRQLQHRILRTHIHFWALVDSSASLSTPEDFLTLYRPHLKSSSVFASAEALSKIWKHDWAFARQFISGANAVLIRLCDQKANPLPEAFTAALKGDPKVQQCIQKVLSGQGSLDSLIESKRIFFIDYKALSSASSKASRPDQPPLYAPIVVFYLHQYQAKQRLMPLAIHLRGVQENRIFTPPKLKNVNELYTSAKGRVWLMARMIAANADANYYEIVRRLGMQRMVTDLAILPFLRHVQDDHHVMQGFLERFGHIMAANVRERCDEKTKDSHLDEVTSIGRAEGLALIGAHFTDSDHKVLSLPEQLRQRGFGEEKSLQPGEQRMLPGYHYHGDAKRAWDAVRRSVSRQIWSGNTSMQVQVAKGPFKGSKMEDLIDAITAIIYHGEVERTVGDYGLLYLYAFIPHRPPVLRKPMPKDLSLVTMDYIMQALPDARQAQSIITHAALAAACNETESKSPSTSQPNQTENEDESETLGPGDSRFFTHMLRLKNKVEARISNTDGINWAYVNPLAVNPLQSLLDAQDEGVVRS